MESGFYSKLKYTPVKLSCVKQGHYKYGT